MYGGTRTQFGDGASPLAVPNIGIDASQKAIQRGASATDVAAEDYYRIQDFGEGQRIESEVRGLLTKFDVEFQRRASLAPGSSSQALYDSDGTLRESVLQDLADEYSGKIGELQGGFMLPESRMKSDAMRQRVSDGVLREAYRQATDLGIKRSREHFQENYDLAIRNEDYAGAGYSVIDARDSGILSAEKADIMLLDLRDTALMARAQKQSEEDPVAFWNELDDDGSPYAVLPSSKRMQLQRLASLSMQGFSRSFVKSVETGNARAEKNPRFQNLNNIHRQREKRKGNLQPGSLQHHPQSSCPLAQIQWGLQGRAGKNRRHALPCGTGPRHDHLAP